MAVNVAPLGNFELTSCWSTNGTVWALLMAPNAITNNNETNATLDMTDFTGVRLLLH
jgi:hypothetical protein